MFHCRGHMSLLRCPLTKFTCSTAYRCLCSKSVKPANPQAIPVKGEEVKDELTRPEASKPHIDVIERVRKIMPPETDYRQRWASQLEEVNKGAVKAKDLIHMEIHWFDDEEKTKETFLEKANLFKQSVTKHRMGHTEFVYAALRVMKDYGVHRDPVAYKALIDVFPKGVMIPDNFIQSGLYHFFKQQWAVIEILHQMESYRLPVDNEIERLVVDTFGKDSYVWRKVARNLYWTSKFINADPNPVPENLSKLEPLELAKIALKRMCPDLQTKITAFSTAQVDGSLDKTWILSAQSPLQVELMQDVPEDEPLYLEGPLRVWLQEHQITYFMLIADNKDAAKKAAEKDDPYDVARLPLNFYPLPKKDALLKPKSVHIQDDGYILALGATGTSSRDSLLSWVRILEQLNPAMKNRRVVFKIQAPITQVEPHQDNSSQASQPPPSQPPSSTSPSSGSTSGPDGGGTYH